MYAYCNGDPINASDPSGLSGLCSSADWEKEFTQAALAVLARRGVTGATANVAVRLLIARETGKRLAIAALGPEAAPAAAILTASFLTGVAIEVGWQMATQPLAQELLAERILPSNAKTVTDWDVISARLSKVNGVNPIDASRRLHKIKEDSNRGPADNVLFDLSGGVYDPVTRKWLGTLTKD